MSIKIRMLRNEAGAPDHVHSRMYHEGETYEVGSADMSDSLAEAFVASGAAEYVSAKASSPAKGAIPPEAPKRGDGEDKLPSKTDKK